VPKPAVVSSVRRAEHRRDVAERVRHRHPGTACRPENPRDFAQCCVIVGDVLDDRDRQGRSERRRCKWQSLRRAADPKRPIRDPCRASKTAGADQALEREVAAHGRRARPRRLDHGVAGSAHADVDERRFRIAEHAAGPKASKVTEAPGLGPTVGVMSELGVEVPALPAVLRITSQLVFVDHHQYAFGDRKSVAVRPADGFVCAHVHRRPAGWAAE